MLIHTSCAFKILIDNAKFLSKSTIKSYIPPTHMFSDVKIWSYISLFHFSPFILEVGYLSVFIVSEESLNLLSIFQKCGFLQNTFWIAVFVLYWKYFLSYHLRLIYLLVCYLSFRMLKCWYSQNLLIFPICLLSFKCYIKESYLF